MENKNPKPIDLFDQARKAYPGHKRKLETEWADFRRRIKDWAKVIPLLLPAIEQQIKEKEHFQKTRQFCPQWPYFQKWIHNRYWENEVYVPIPPNKETVIEKYWREARGCLKNYHKYIQENIDKPEMLKAIHPGAIVLYNRERQEKGDKK